MKIITKKRSIKLILIQVAILISLIATQAVIQFTKEYVYVGFMKKDGSAMQIAESAEGDLSACNIDLAQAIKDKQTAEQTNNPDLFTNK